MAQWNPYYDTSSNSLYEEQNVESQIFNQSVPYGAVPLYSGNFPGYYMPTMTDYRSSMPVNIRTAQDVEAEQFSQYLNRIPVQNVTQSQYFHDGSTQTQAVHSTLTATAAEFKPSTSYTPIVSQTFSNNNLKNNNTNMNRSFQSGSEPVIKPDEVTFPPSLLGTQLRSSDSQFHNNYDNRMKNNSNRYSSRNSPKADNFEQRGGFDRYKQGERQKMNKDQRYERTNRTEDNEKYRQSTSRWGRDNRERREGNDRYGRNYERYRGGRNDSESGNYNGQNNKKDNNIRYKEQSEEQNLNNSEQMNRKKINTQENETKVELDQNGEHVETSDRQQRQDSIENNESGRDNFDNSTNDIQNSRYTHNYRDRHNRQDTTKNDNVNMVGNRGANSKYTQNNKGNNYRGNRDYSGRPRQDQRDPRNTNARYSQEREWKDRGARGYRGGTDSGQSYPSDNYGSRNSRYSKNNSGEPGYSRNYDYERSNSNNYKNPHRSNYNDESKYENWRSNTPFKPIDKYEKESKKTDVEKVTNIKKTSKNEADISQRDRLIDQANKGTLECLVCCEHVRQVDKVWSCQKCYHVFHLRCSFKWAKTSQDENGWRCPACQHVCNELPQNYYCYCGKTMDPVYRPGDTAHSCGSVCGRPGLKPGCPHKCRLLCHPGPCPICEDLISRSCNCGATKQMVKCNASAPLVCKAVCGKNLNCGIHTCQKLCHPNECDTCAETIDQECFCGKAKRTVTCTAEHAGINNYSCDAMCDKLLTCGNHKCSSICHPGDCPPCVRGVEQVRTCPCGKTQLTEERKTCLDPIPCCDKICGKRYVCGPPSNPHTCQANCHDGDCPVCTLSSQVLCRCGHMSKEVPCSELSTRVDDARCEKKCTKKRSCAKHKCNQLCCIDVDHICPLPCNRTLSCGQHRCEQTCHKGRCQPCWRISFEELYCECGASVIYPPVMCGTKRPPCSRPCTRTHDCEHEPQHTCHSQPDCPPCTVLTTKWCHGRHEQRKTIPCHQKEFSCGLPCNKELPCGRHKCILPCHKGPCLKEGQSCVQLCSVPRETCGHPCGLPCHDPPCPESPCKEMVKVSCECGLRTSTRACIDMAGEYQRIANSMLASKMADMQLGHSIDISDVVGTTRSRVLKTLECTDECRIIERNRRMAIGLQIRNPDLSAKLTPRYSDFMRQWAKKDARFVQMVHDKLTELVQLAKQSKQKSRSYSFDSMNRDKRHLIHEYCEHFGCESAAYDQEPNRNVVATASRDKAWLPSCSVLELLQRESGQRKVPGPILNRPLGAGTSSGTVSLRVSSSAAPRASYSGTTQNSQAQTPRPKTPPGETIDYFDYDVSK